MLRDQTELMIDAWKRRKGQISQIKKMFSDEIESQNHAINPSIKILFPIQFLDALTQV